MGARWTPHFIYGVCNLVFAWPTGNKEGCQDNERGEECESFQHECSLCEGLTPRYGRRSLVGMEPETQSSILAKVAHLDEQIQEIIDLGDRMTGNEIFDLGLRI